MKREEKRKTEKVIVDGNAFYELDLDCIERQKRKRESLARGYKKKRQRK